MRRSTALSIAFLLLVSCGGGGGGGGNGGGGGPTTPEVFYVRGAAGNDRSDGLSPQTAFQTIGAAAARVRAGDTVIVGPGTYKEGIVDPAGGTAAAPVIFMADPTGGMTADPAGQVVVDTTGVLDNQGQAIPGFRLSGASYVTVDGFLITGGGTAGVQVRLNSDNVTIQNCEIFRNSGDGVLVQSSMNVTLFDNAVYSNTRRGIAVVGSANARLINNTVALNEDRGVFLGSRNNVASPNAVLRNNILQDNLAVNVQVTTEPESSLVGYTSLNDLVFPARYQPTGLPRPGDLNADALFVSGVLGNFRLTAASPARNAGVADGLSTQEISMLRGRTTSSDGVADDDGQLDIGFHYPLGSAAPPPGSQVYYVRASGSDSGNGLTPQSAFRTIGRALRLARAGDQVVVGPGRYPEALLSPPSGSATAPVLVRADVAGTLTGDAPGRALVDANGEVAGFRLTQVEFVTLDGFTVSGGRQSGIQVRGGSRQVTIQNCQVFTNEDGIRIDDSREVLVFNNLVARNRRRGIFVGGTVSGSQNTRLINNTVAQNADRGIFIGATTAASTGTIVQNNIVFANTGTGVQVTDGSEVGFSAAFNVVFPLTRPDAYFPRNLPRTEDINEDPRLVSGPGGDFYLDQTASPAVDSGDPQLRTELREALGRRTTDMRGFADTGRVDRGFHFPR